MKLIVYGNIYGEYREYLRRKYKEYNLLVFLTYH